MVVEGFVEKSAVRRWFRAEVNCAVHLGSKPVQKNLSIKQVAPCFKVELHCVGRKKIEEAWVPANQLRDVITFENRRKYINFLRYRESQKD